MENVVFKNVTPDELEAAVTIERECFSPDEAASLDSFRFRQAQAPDLFLGAYLASSSENLTLIGYACSTLSPSQSLTHDSMFNHIPNSSSVCVHAVAVAPAQRRKGIGSALMREYISRLSATKTYERILLIVHEEFKLFYEGVGFELVGPSLVQHGLRPWYEMRKILRLDSGEAHAPAPALRESQPLPPGLFAALKRPSKGPSAARKLEEFERKELDVSVPHGEGDGMLTNKYDLLCPRAGCASVILKSGVGEWVERASCQMDPPDEPVHPDLFPLPKPPSTTSWWLITPSPMAFENIGFTRAIQLSGQSSEPMKKLKFLICADCDLGPLGWAEEGGKEFWLACSRVKYATDCA